jgi:hypothetical protein
MAVMIAVVKGLRHLEPEVKQTVVVGELWGCSAKLKVGLARFQKWSEPSHRPFAPSSETLQESNASTPTK